MKGTIINDTYIKREDEKQKLRMAGGSWTINLRWLHSGVKKIQYITLLDTYTITLEDAIRYGFKREFQSESKLVVPLEYWSYSRKPKPVEKSFVPAVEKCKAPKQTSLF